MIRAELKKFIRQRMEQLPEDKRALLEKKDEEKVALVLDTMTEREKRVLKKRFGIKDD